jgi:hypothetical protein
MLFRELDRAEVMEFKQWARDFYLIGEPINRELWHPVVVAECDLMNSEKPSRQG